MRGQIRWWRTEWGNWRFERVEVDGKLRWEVTGWRKGAEEETISLGRWVAWKSAIDSIIAWEGEHQI